VALDLMAACLSGCAAYWCGPCVIGHLHDRFVQRGSYYRVSIPLVILMLLYIFLPRAFENRPKTQSDVQFLLWMILIVTTAVLTYKARQQIQRHYQIPVSQSRDTAVT
jgi:integral membrane sensor domain MASE1